MLGLKPLLPLLFSLLLGGVEASERDIEGDTALHRAIRSGQSEVAHALIESGCDLSARNGRGETPLHLAAERDEELALTLLDLGVDPTVRTRSGKTPLLIALSGQGYPTLIQRLIDRRAGLSIPSSDETTPLHWTVYSPSLTQWAAPLLLAGADPHLCDCNGRTLLHCAASCGAVAVASLLLEREASVDARDLEGRTPLHCAASAESLEMVALLIDRGANPCAVDNEGNAPLHLACSVVCGKRVVPMVELLLNSAGEVNRRNWRGETPLHRASASCSGAVATLLQRGAEPNARRCDGVTPLLAGISTYSHYDDIKALLDGGADLHAVDSEGRTPLHHAMKSENLRLIKLLIDRGSDLSARDHEGRGALEGALVAYWSGDPTHRAIATLFDKGEERAEQEEMPVETYSFTTPPLISPRIVQDLVTWLSDSGNQIVAIDLEGSQGSNRYYGAFEEEGDGASIDFGSEGCFPICFSYRCIGQLDNGVYLLLTSDRGGGSGIFQSLLLVALEEEARITVDWQKGEIRSGPPRTILKKIGEIGLGDRWTGELAIEGNAIYIGEDQGIFSAYGEATPKLLEVQLTR